MSKNTKKIKINYNHKLISLQNKYPELGLKKKYQILILKAEDIIEHLCRTCNIKTESFICNLDDKVLNNCNCYDRRCEIMDEAFPKLPFGYDNEHADRLDEVLVESKNAIVFHPKKCIVCRPNDIGAEIIPIVRDRYITYRDFYKECEAKWAQEMCNHQFLEDIQVKNNCQIELWFGS